MVLQFFTELRRPNIRKQTILQLSWPSQFLPETTILIRAEPIKSRSRPNKPVQDLHCKKKVTVPSRDVTNQTLSSGEIKIIPCWGRENRYSFLQCTLPRKNLSQPEINGYKLETANLSRHEAWIESNPSWDKSYQPIIVGPYSFPLWTVPIQPELVYWIPTHPNHNLNYPSEPDPSFNTLGMQPILTRTTFVLLDPDPSTIADFVLYESDKPLPKAGHKDVNSLTVTVDS